MKLADASAKADSAALAGRTILRGAQPVAIWGSRYTDDLIARPHEIVRS